ncbi:hypothetical protein L873DRAFT_1790494 [Choiromyces venosus 120613-1]|uniref:Uncharacterized protein n=1 Tax=Choiromyces venosus 120613-1 TaxID=1336337 RepID=A0A3N4JN04_9PEZI|nr:hypothetical protein L873DRAFT_1790494 [Choiromyces venosus 120613-1]
MVFTSKFLLTLKTDISTPRHLLMPVRCVSESSRCQPSNSTSHNLLASVSAKLQAAIKMVFTGEFLLTLKTDISMLIRHVPESPQCQLSNTTSHVLLISVPGKL